MYRTTYRTHFYNYYLKYEIKSIMYLLLIYRVTNQGCVKITHHLCFASLVTSIEHVVSIVESIKSHNNDGYQQSVTPEATKQEHDIMLPVITFEDDDEDKEEEHKMWQTLFLLENHRKYGTPLPLTEELISLHET